MPWRRTSRPACRPARPPRPWASLPSSPSWQPASGHLARGPLTAADMNLIQNDTYSSFADTLVSYLLDVDIDTARRLFTLVCALVPG